MKPGKVYFCYQWWVVQLLADWLVMLFSQRVFWFGGVLTDTSFQVPGLYFGVALLRLKVAYSHPLGTLTIRMLVSPVWPYRGALKYYC